MTKLYCHNCVAETEMVWEKCQYLEKGKEKYDICSTWIIVSVETH